MADSLAGAKVRKQVHWDRNYCRQSLPDHGSK